MKKKPELPEVSIYAQVFTLLPGRNPLINRIDGFHQLSGTGFEIAALLRVRVSISKIQAVVFEVICAWIFLQKVIEKE